MSFFEGATGVIQSRMYRDRKTHLGFLVRLQTMFLFSCGSAVEELQGHQWYHMTEEVGGVEKRFLEKFGNIVRWKGPLGVRLACY